jgi:hypothetical protein
MWRSRTLPDILQRLIKSGLQEEHICGLHAIGAVERQMVTVDVDVAISISAWGTFQDGFQDVVVHAMRVYSVATFMRMASQAGHHTMELVHNPHHQVEIPQERGRSRCTRV